MDEKIQNIMTCLNCTRDEAIQVIKDDEQIDKGVKLFELTKEQKDNVKKTIRVSSGQYTKSERIKKEYPDKKHLIKLIENALIENGINPTVQNDEREMTFMYNNVNYKITMSCPRK